MKTGGDAARALQKASLPLSHYSRAAAGFPTATQPRATRVYRSRGSDDSDKAFYRVEWSAMDGTGGRLAVISALGVSPTKAIVLLLLVVPALGLLLFGPSSKQSLPPDRVIVDYWEKWTADEGDQMKQIVDDFNNSVGAQKHIYVRYVSISTINQKTLIATAAGVPP